MRRERLTRGLLLGTLLVLTPAARAMDDNDIKRSIQRGVTYLRSIQSPADGTWTYTEIGATALAGLTLLECGVRPDDTAVQRAAAAVRNECPRLKSTYSLSLAIMFLDRLGDKEDTPLIQSMAVRLLAGQDSTGGWVYTCPVPGGEEEVERLKTFVSRRNELVGRREAPRPGPGPLPGVSATGRPGTDPASRPPLGKEIQGQVDQLRRMQEAQARAPGRVPTAAELAMATRGSDNSNTQFAVLALWIARRHGVPTEQALLAAEERFRRTQNADYGWGYTVTPIANQSTPTMTCSGLLGLAVGHGSANEAALRRKGAAGRVRDPGTDPVIVKGLRALATTIGVPVGNKEPGVIPQLGQAAGKAYYFLWSLDRVAMAFGLDTLGGKDWYTWGAEIALSSQLPDGSWKGEYDRAGIDTSFALLFLRRSNLTEDLTSSLRGRVRDKVQLRADFGGAALKRRLKPGIEFRGSHSGESKAPPRAGSPEGTRLSRELVSAGPTKRERLLRSYRDHSGEEYTEGLALAIPQLDANDRAQAREALAQRFTRMKAVTLREKLKEDGPEIRRAAALACAMKDDRQHIPDLIPLLEDPEPMVASAAHRALKSLANEDLGPKPDATTAERAQAVQAWREWWQRKGGR